MSDPWAGATTRVARKALQEARKLVPYGQRCRVAPQPEIRRSGRRAAAVAAPAVAAPAAENDEPQAGGDEWEAKAGSLAVQLQQKEVELQRAKQRIELAVRAKNKYRMRATREEQREPRRRAFYTYSDSSDADSSDE